MRSYVLVYVTDIWIKATHTAPLPLRPPWHGRTSSTWFIDWLFGSHALTLSRARARAVTLSLARARAHAEPGTPRARSR